MTSRLETYGPFMESVAQQSGAIIREGFHTPLQVAFKGDMTPVTRVDYDVNTLVAERIREAFPTHGFIGEESGGMPMDERTWVCDPLDGTRPYVNGIPLAAFSLSLIEQGEPVCSIIHDPFINRSIFSAAGEGAWSGGRRLSVSSHRTLENADIHTSWGDKGYGKRLNSMRRLGAKVIKVDATVYAGMLVAMGKLDADIFTGRDPWDIAAQALAIREAGGRTSTLTGDDLVITESMSGSIMSNGHIHDTLLELIQTSLENKESHDQ